MITLESRIIIPSKRIGVTPAVTLLNPKYPANFAGALRACACMDIQQLWFTGNRLEFDEERLPRELRHKDYLNTQIYKDDRFLDKFTDIRPIAIEIVPGSQNIVDFEWSDKDLLIFGSEDSNVPSNILRQCHAIVQIPSRYCLNLVASLNIVLYDRQAKLERSTDPWK